MKFVLAQLDPKIGDFKGTLEKMTEAVSRAKATGASLLVFPELAICGYPPRDFLDYPSFIDANLRALDSLAKLSTGITIVCGFVEPNPSPDGKPFFNAAAILREGRKLATYHKQLLPYYDVFEEDRYFERGGDPCVFSVDGKRIGVTICEDGWNSSFLKRPYSIDPLAFLAKQKVDLVLNLSASPFALGRAADRKALFQKDAERVKAPVAFCNQVGAHDELIFDGCSFVVTPTGDFLSTAKAFQEDQLVVELGVNGTHAAWPSSDDEWIAEALALGVRDYVTKCGAKKVCLGLSGGIDSAVVAAIAVKAVGKENVVAVGMPTKFTSPNSLEDAETLAKRLGISYRVISVDKMFELFHQTLKPKQSLTAENIQPRLRMTILMAICNDENLLLLNTSNKSEIACGYATLYGDSAGAVAVLGDLVKNQVYSLARFFNRATEVIPKRILERAPSAELKENQTDQDTLPAYDVLDQMVKETVENEASLGDLIAKGFLESDAKTFSRLHAISEYKRRQLPPALRVSRRAFGMGRRMPIAAKAPW